MTNRRARSKKISNPISTTTTSFDNNSNIQVLDSDLRDRMNYALKIRKVKLEHHNTAYRWVFWVFIWMMLLTYVPLTYFLFKFVFCNQDTLKEYVSIWAQKDLGIVLGIIYIIPIYLLSGLLKYNRIDTSQDSSEEDNVLTHFIPGP
jgi:hypothetical protein